MTNKLMQSDKITEGLRKSFQDVNCKMANRSCYGYTETSDGEIIISKTEAAVVRWIFDCYLDGNSLGKIATGLAKQRILSNRQSQVESGGYFKVII